uniref:Uncharacterized protein n=1 Tax=Megaselia scalaris TaxID=36166 RepID=T1H3E7_MEGSC
MLSCVKAAVESPTVSRLVENHLENSRLNMNSSWYSQNSMMLIGQKDTALKTSREIIEIKNTGYSISKTKLGWTISGPIFATPDDSNYV